MPSPHCNFIPAPLLAPPQVAGDDTPAIDTVMACDVERTQLMEEEAAILAQLEGAGAAGSAAGAAAPAAANGADASGDSAAAAAAAPAAAAAAAAASGEQLELTRRLEAVSKRLHEIDAYGAEARAAAILAGLSFDPDMQVGRGPRGWFRQARWLGAGAGACCAWRVQPTPKPYVPPGQRSP
jgi:hypothetical protein